GKCGLCGNSLRKMFSRQGKQFVGCSGYPDCKNIYPLPQGAFIQPTGAVCPSCKTPMIKVRRKGKRQFEMCLLPTCETKKDWGRKEK
ncbi:topoisomerase DNA-binding C4 zinc finger domain-containing protein, partial [Candidatus Micrarchaeota archaeon]|nr:topoisomerase DNA-binding C4 zinc finger domain-containing protein [Candidatus Micrarchaeota archaeon]